MGNFHITIQAVGAHLNKDGGSETDADRMADKFVDELVAAGHTVERAVFHSGNGCEVTLFPRTTEEGKPDNSGSEGGSPEGGGTGTGSSTEDPPEGGGGTGSDPEPPKEPEAKSDSPPAP